MKPIVPLPYGYHVAALKPVEPSGLVIKNAGERLFTVVALCRRRGPLVNRDEYVRAFGHDAAVRICQHCLLLVDEYAVTGNSPLQVFTAERILWNPGGRNRASTVRRRWRPRPAALLERNEITTKRRAA